MLKFYLLLISITYNFISVTCVFENSRCRCICPDLSMVGVNNSDHRRYYTNAAVKQNECNANTIVKPNVVEKVHDTEIKAFLEKCTCKFESRNTKMLQVVVVFVIFVICSLVAYMMFLVCLDPMLRQKRSQFQYQEQRNELDSNIFNASNTPVANANENAQPENELENRTEPAQIRERLPSHGVLERVEAKQSKWMRKVEAQRRSIFDDHTMLN